MLIYLVCSVADNSVSAVYSQTLIEGACSHGKEHDQYFATIIEDLEIVYTHYDYRRMQLRLSCSSPWMHYNVIFAIITFYYGRLLKFACFSR